MSFATLLIGLSVCIPLALLLACTFRPIRNNMLCILPYAPIPALAAAILSIDAPAFVLGNTRIPVAFALDLPSAILLGAAAVLWIACGFYALNTMRQRPDAGKFSVCWLMTLAACMGVYLAADMVSFYGFLALLSIGASCLVMHEETPASRYAAMAYLGVALFAECFLLIAFVLLASITPGNSLWISDAARALADSSLRNVILALLIIGFGIKAGLIPMHFFLPLAHGISMIPVAAVISGAVIKASLFGFIRFLPHDIALPNWGMALAALGLFGALYGVIVGLTQQKPKVVLAYSTVSQMGFIVAIIGMGIMVADENARLAAAFYAARHILAKGGLFLAVGVIAASSLRRYWIIFTPVLLLALSFAGLPLTGGSLAKAVSKSVMGDGLAYTIATLSSVATTLLMLHFLRCLKQTLLSDPNAKASKKQTLPWLALTLASFIIPIAIYLIAPNHELADALTAKALWSALWPILVGILLALGLFTIKPQLPEVTPGDIGSAMLNALTRPAQGMSTVLVKLDTALGRWPLAAMTLLSLLILFGLAMTLSH